MTIGRALADDLEALFTYPATTSAMAEDGLRRAFEAAGARVSRQARFAGAPATSVADFAVWHDGLASSLGVPLPVEVLWGRKTRLRTIVPRLLTTLAWTATPSLLAVLPSVEHPTRVLAPDNRQVLVVPPLALIHALRDDSLPEALGHLLADADLADR